MSREMVNSEIPWIGEIPKSWRIIRNKNIFSNSKTLVGEEWVNTQLLSLTTKGIKAVAIGSTSGKVPDSYDTYQVVEIGNIVMCLFDLDCSAVFSGLSSIRGMISPAYKALTIKNGFMPEFYAKWFEYIFDGRKFMSLSKNIRYSLTYDDFASLQIVAPSLSEQQKIAYFLDRKCSEIDEMIALQEKIVEELKAYKQSIITEAVTKGLNPDVPMKDSGIKWIKQIPQHWNAITPKALFSLRKDKAKEGERQLTASQHYGVIYQDEYTEITGNKVVTVMKDFDILKHVEVGDFVISMRSFQGGLEYSTKSGSISSAYVMLIPNLNHVYPRFYRWLFKSIGYINALQSTSNMVRDGQAMRYSNFAQVPLYQVPINEQKDIADYLDKKCEEIDKMLLVKQSKIKSLQEYKKSIIYEYVTGKKEVTE